MAHFAKIDNQNLVEMVVVLKNKVILDSKGKESEKNGNEFLNSIGMPGKWIQCSYNSTFKRAYPKPGSWFDSKKKMFLDSPSPFNSWTYNRTLDQWEPPIVRPDDHKNYFWNEEKTEWMEVAL